MKKVLAYFVLLAAVSNSFCSERELDNITPRYPRCIVNYLNKETLSPEFQKFARQGRKIEQPPVQSIYAQIFEDAQATVRVAAEDTLPVYKETNIGDVARVDRDKIVTSELFDPLSPGEKRAFAHHEAVHAKYNDYAGLDWLLRKFTYIKPLASLALSSALYNRSSACTENNQPLLRAVPVIAALCGLNLAALAAYRITKRSFENYREWRADFESLRHLKCFLCVTEIRRFREPATIALQGAYMTSQEMHPFFETFANHNLLCTLHKSAKTIKIPKEGSATSRIVKAAIPPIPNHVHDDTNLPLNTSFPPRRTTKLLPPL